RLFLKLREEMGVGYYVRASNDAYTDYGVFQVSTGVNHTRIPEVVEVILEEFTKISLTEVEKDELEKAKQYIIGGIERSLEGSEELGEFYGFQEVLRQKIKSEDDLIKEIEKVGPKDILRVA